VYFPEFDGRLANVDGRDDESSLNASFPNGPLEIDDAELLGKLLSGDDVIGGWNGSLAAVLAGWELVSGKRFTGSLVEAGNGSFDAVLVEVPNGSLLVAGDVVSGAPKTLSAEPLSEVPKGSSLPNGADEVVAGPLSSEPKPGLLDSSVDDGSFKLPAPPSSDDSGVRSNSPLGSELLVSDSEPRGSFLRVLSVDVPNDSLPVDEPNSFEPPIVSG
jgi:hypothetical protein